jgi:hypothetical protein
MYDLDRLKEGSDLVEVARSLGLDPKKAGSHYVARCPAHKDEGRPNLSLDQKKGAMCFRCGYHADVIDLVAKVKNVERGEAISWLAGRLGLQPDQAQGSKGAKGSNGLGYRHKAKPAPVYPKGADLPPDPPASTPVAAQVDQLVDHDQPKRVALIWPAAAHVPTIGGQWRRLEDGRIEAKYTPEELYLCLSLVGYQGPPPTQIDQLVDAQPITAQADQVETLRVRVYRALLEYTRPAADEPAGVAWLRENKGLSIMTQAAAGVCWLEDWAKADRELKAIFGVETLDGLGLLTKSGDLHFKRHRLLFPFWVKTASTAAPVYAQGRDIEATDKRYRFDNPSGPVPCPYNAAAISEARRSGKSIFLCEGATDTLTLTQADYLACGIVGTQGFKPDWATHFAGLSVFLAFDPDQSGREAAQKVAGVFVAADLPAPRIVTLPDGQDVTDFFTGKATKVAVKGG